MEIDVLHQLFLKCNTICTDTRKIKKNDLFFALKGDNFNGNSYAEKALELGAKYAVIDESEYYTSSQTILVDNTLNTLQELATFHRNYLKTPIIALTGSNGKTTTKELINTILSQKYITTATIGNLNNHIGVPLTLLSLTEETEIGIIEMGANHQKEIKFLCSISQPDFGLITNYGKAHLEGFGGVEGVIKGKSEMYDFLINHDKTIFINGNDVIQVDKTKNANTFSFGNSKEDMVINFIEANPFVICNFEDEIIHSQLIGDYNFTNIAYAITIGSYFKVDTKAIKNAIENYIPKNNRSQIINKNSNKIILDAYNANPSSMQAAISNFEKQTGNKIAILGDMFELGNDAKVEHQYIVDLAISSNIDKIIFVGENFNGIVINSIKSSKYSSFESFKNSSEILELKNTTILIKGSRGMALERILDII